MQTYSHYIITAALNKRMKDKTDLQVNSRAFLLGSLMPDVPLYILSFVFFFQRFVLSDDASSELFGQAYDNLYFNDPLWIIGHSAFHAPLMITLYLAVGYWWGIRGKRNWAHALFWFALGCGLHTTLDIFTHHNDGPLLFFPFDWQTRFSSPISYWDPQYGGRIFFPLEHLLDLGLLAYLIMPFLRRRFGRESTQQA